MMIDDGALSPKTFAATRFRPRDDHLFTSIGRATSRVDTKRYYRMLGPRANDRPASAS